MGVNEVPGSKRMMSVRTQTKKRDENFPLVPSPLTVHSLYQSDPEDASSHHLVPEVDPAKGSYREGRFDPPKDSWRPANIDGAV
eukprot:scaffold3134_cov182-Amphora_coffeaeformis.AAC.14